MKPSLKTPTAPCLLPSIEDGPATPAAPEHHPAPPVPLVAGVSVAVLARFRRLMAAEGLAVDLPRICLDRLYAFERIARGHASANDRLRAMALQLFAAYHCNEPVTALH